MLTTAGYAVTAVSDGVNAIEVASAETFQLHILDAVMPTLSGRETCERIRAVRPGARFLFTSGYGGDALPASFLKDMGIEVIAKPFDPDTMLRAVRATLDAPAATTPSRGGSARIGIPVFASARVRAHIRQSS